MRRPREFGEGGCVANPMMIVNTIAGVALCGLAIAATGARIWETSVVEEQAHSRELFAAYCIGVFGPDQSGLNWPLAPACLTNEPADQCSARTADIQQERHRVDFDLKRLQEILATHGAIAPERHITLAKYLVATSCWEDE